MNYQEINNKIQPLLPVLQKKYHVKKIGVFGSFARNEATNASDIDILVEFSQPIGFFDFIRLENFLSQTLGKKVDLISKPALKQIIKDAILKETIYV